ncbi:unnamed protein product [Paramecium octaurelia]|uniref:Transmembrane protein n=1 Tax=Paramecium octaurelia TaxID=43137 RepID=A0A8S1YJX3_PAROT|nr:unnamed protein product [Paramecium octaurelia]
MYSVNMIRSKSDLIIPKQKFIFIIKENNLFRRDAVIDCYRILNKNNPQNQIQHQTEMIMQNICQIKQQILWKFNYPNSFKNSTYNLQNSKGSLNVSIMKYSVFQHDVQQDFINIIIKVSFNQMKQQINTYVFNLNPFFISMIVNKQKSKFQQTQINIMYSTLLYSNIANFIMNFSLRSSRLQSKMAFYFVNRKNTNVLRVAQFYSKSLKNFNIKLNEEITSFLTNILKHIFLHQQFKFASYFNDEFLAKLMGFQVTQVLRDYLIGIFIFRQYLQKNLYQPEPILFYQEIGNSKLIQYAKTQVIQNKENLRCYQFTESIIIYIQPQNIINYYIMVAIQNSTRSLILSQIIKDYIEFKIILFKTIHFIILQCTQQTKIILLFQQNQIFRYIQLFFNKIIICLYQRKLSKLMISFLILMDKIYCFLSTRCGGVHSCNNFLKNHQDILSSNFSMYHKEEGAVELKIQVENDCFELHSLMKSPIINIQNNKSVKLNVSEMFYCPISNLTLLDNSNIILKGLIQIKQAIQNCHDQTSTFCIREYHFKTYYFRVFVEENHILEVLRSSSINNFYITCIKQEYFLCVSQLVYFLNIELIECSQKHKENCQMISNFNNSFKLIYINISETKRVGNLIKLKGDKHTAFIIIEDINFMYKYIQYIEESNNQYLILQNYKKDSNDLEITIYSINLHQKYQIYSLVITEKMSAEMIYGYFNISKLKMKLVSCKYFGKLINIKLFIMNQFVLQFFFQLNLDLQKNQIQQKSQYQLRNFITNYNIKTIHDFDIQYLDDTLFVLKQNEDACSQFYQFQENRTFYDYFTIRNFQSSQNTTKKAFFFGYTHFIFYNLNQVKLGLIGYELEIQNYDQIEQNFQLFTQNLISNVKLSLQIHVVKTSEQLTNSILVVQIFWFIFIIIYTRTAKSKYRNQVS